MLRVTPRRHAGGSGFQRRLVVTGRIGGPGGPPWAFWAAFKFKPGPDVNGPTRIIGPTCRAIGGTAQLAEAAILAYVRVALSHPHNPRARRAARKAETGCLLTLALQVGCNFLGYVEPARLAL